MDSLHNECCLFNWGLWPLGRHWPHSVPPKHLLERRWSNSEQNHTDFEAQLTMTAPVQWFCPVWLLSVTFCSGLILCHRILKWLLLVISELTFLYEQPFLSLAFSKEVSDPVLPSCWPSLDGLGFGRRTHMFRCFSQISSKSLRPGRWFDRTNYSSWFCHRLAMSISLTWAGFGSQWDQAHFILWCMNEGLQGRNHQNCFFWCNLKSPNLAIRAHPAGWEARFREGFSSHCPWSITSPGHGPCLWSGLFWDGWRVFPCVSQCQLLESWLQIPASMNKDAHTCLK